MEWWSLAANIWERHRLSEKVNVAESAKGEAGEEEEWRGPLHVAAPLWPVWGFEKNKGGGGG